MDTQQIGRQVLRLRRELGISQESLARRACLSRNYISLIERGVADNVSLNVVAQLARALGVPPADLLGEPPGAKLIPPALRQFALAEGLRYDVVEWLMQMPKRGPEPRTPEQWRALYSAVRVYLDDTDGN